MKRFRPRFSLKALFALVTIIAIVLGGWIGYSRYKVRKLVELRQQGAIVILRDRTPSFLQSIGLKNMSPFFDVPTVELYVNPKGSEASVGNTENLISNTDAQVQLLRQASIARNYGAEDIQLILLTDESVPDWSAFAKENSFSTIRENPERYRKRLEANQESGGNINP
jgi:hypothetical protein